MKLKLFVVITVLFFLCPQLKAQNSFVDYQKSFSRVSDVFKRKEDTLKRQFAAKNLYGLQSRFISGLLSMTVNWKYG